MAKFITVGSTDRKGSFCPQCRRKVPKENRFVSGINCPRCGFFRWEEFAKFKSLDGIPVPTIEDKIEATKFFEEEKKLATKKKVVKKSEDSLGG